MQTGTQADRYIGQTGADRYTGRQVQRQVHRQTGAETGTQADRSRERYIGQTGRDLPSVPLSHWCPSISWSIMAKKCVLASSVITQPPVTISRRPESISLHIVTPMSGPARQ